MKTCIQTLATLAFAASITLAQNAPKGPKEGKGIGPEKAFAKLDADSNGSLSVEEFKASPMAKKKPERAEQVFAKMDKDSSGTLTLEEFKDRPAKGGKKDKRVKAD
ncbi:MAG: EF-hand domain-containing protein [Akkermansiaceae bacterium]